MTAKENRGFFSSLVDFPGSFWLLNTFQMLEKMAYWIVVIQLPIYIAQKDAVGGLQWGQETKGWIFLWWALVQNLSPLLAGGFADKFGYRRTLFVSFILGTAGYLMLGFSRDFIPFFAGTIVLGLGLGIFKPAIQGSVAHKLSGRNAALGWGVYFMLMNLAVFVGGPVSKLLKEISWDMVFWGSAVILAMNFILLLFLPRIKTNDEEIKPLDILKNIFSKFLLTDIKWFILVMSGFAIIYMQFYETLPNFIFDWVDSSGIVETLGLPAAMIQETDRGMMVSYEFLYSINSGLIIIGIAFVSWVFSRIDRMKALMAGILLASAGLFLTGYTTIGYFTILGIVIYTVGEMITNPKFTEHLGETAPPNEKAMYLSYLNVSFAVGLGGGGLMGGYLYKHLGEKAFLAKNFLVENFGSGYTDTGLDKSFSVLMEKTGLNAADATNMLWNEYSPWLVWLPFMVIGLLSVGGMYLYGRKKGSEFVS